MAAGLAFLFDLDGTLADTLPDIAASANHVRAVHGLAPLPLAAIRGMVGDGARALLRAALAEVLAGAPGSDERAIDEAYEIYSAHHLEACTGATRLFPGARQHLETLRAAGHPLAVVTNKPERFAGRVLSHLGVGELLPVVVGGDTLPQKKPDPAPLRHALAQLGAGPADAVMVGDGVQDLRAAKATGIAAIACLYGYGDPERLRAECADGYWVAFGVPAPPRISGTT